MISSSQRTTRLPIEFYIEPIVHLDRCCPVVDQSTCLDISSEGQEASHLHKYIVFSGGRQVLVKCEVIHVDKNVLEIC